MAIFAYILVTLKSGAERDVCKKLSSLEEVIQVDELYGEYDAIAKIEGGDYKKIGQIVVDKVRTIDGIVDTKTLSGYSFEVK